MGARPQIHQDNIVIKALDGPDNLCFLGDVDIGGLCVAVTGADKKQIGHSSGHSSLIQDVYPFIQVTLKALGVSVPVHQGMQVWRSQIQVHQQHPLAQPGKQFPDICRYHGLADTAFSAPNGIYLRLSNNFYPLK